VGSTHLEVSHEARDAQAQECERGGLVHLLGIVSKPDV
jgi:hypothetical protein